MMMAVLGVVIGVYIMLEAIHQMAEMDGGDRACRVAKYVLSALSGLLLAWYGVRLHIDWLHISLASCIALFVWPKMLTRFYHVFKFERRRIDRMV